MAQYDIMPRPSSLLGTTLKLAFVGRRSELDVFEDMLFPGTAPLYQVFSLVGVGGQGKTTLLDQFAQRMTALDCKDRPVCRLDFGLPQHRSMIEGLFFLRNQLRTQGVATHAFDVAFARHFAFTRPGRDIKLEYPELYRFAEDSLFGELVDIGAEAVSEIPGGKLAVALLARASNRIAQWYTTRGVPILSQLDAMHPQRLGIELPVFLGFDVLEFVTAHPQRRPVFLVDTYEALWRDTGSSSALTSPSGDQWIRRLVEECPGCLWIMAGRHRLKWSQHDSGWTQYVVERDLGALTPEEADALLDAGAITSVALRAALREVASGHPLSLALGIRYCQMKALGGAAITEHDVPRTQQEVLDRFFDHLDPAVRGLVRVLAVPTLVHIDLWSYLARSAFPVFDLYAASTILEDVFFRVVSEQEYAMHDRVRQHLLEELPRREPDLLRRARLAVFDFYDQAAAGGGQCVPDLSGNVRQRDGCLVEASDHLLEAAPERYIRWCEQQLERTKNGSRQRQVLIERAGRVLSTIGEGNLLDATILARLRLCADPWDASGLDLLDSLAIQIEGKVLNAELITPLRQIASDLHSANPSRLPPSILRALLRSGVEDIGLAILAGDLESAARWAEQSVRQENTLDVRASWFALVAIARSARVDLCEFIGERLGSQQHDLGFWVTLAQVVDTFCFEKAPQLGLLVAQGALRAPDSESVVRRLQALEPSVITHQVVLTLYDALIGVGALGCARQLIDQRFDDSAKRNFAMGLEQLLIASGHNALETDEGRQFIETFEQECRVVGFAQGYLEAALATDPDFARTFSVPALAAVRAEITRSYDVYKAFGGHPSTATMRRGIRFDLVRTDRSEVFLFLNDALILYRPVDWLAFDAEWRFRFHDVRQGHRSFGFLGVAPELELNIGDGASLLLVLTDDAQEPIQGEYMRFYGHAW